MSADPWVLSTSSWDDGYQGAYLGNGYLGSMFHQTGTSVSRTGPEASYVAGAYEHEALASQPPLLPLEITANGQTFGADGKRVRNYRQELRLREGLLVTRGTWDTGAGEVDLEVTTALLRSRPDMALLWVRLKNRGQRPAVAGVPETVLGPRAGGTVTPSAFTLNGSGLRYRGSLVSLDGPLGAAAGRRAAYSIPGGASASLVLVTRVDGGSPLRGLASGPAAPPSPRTVEQWLTGHRQAWDRLWARDIEISGDPEAQQAVRACLFYLFSSARPESVAGVPPMGLSSPAFNGHVFWDMDSWMLPALLPQHPDLARAMLEYRFRTLPGARANAAAEGLPGASYAWESASTGRETLRGEVFSHGRHVSGDVALALRQYYAFTGDRAWLRETAWPVLRATADNWVARAKPAPGGKRVIQGVTTPDENAGLVSHSAWAHWVARKNLLFAAEAARELGQAADAKWTSTASALDFLRDPSGMILAYAGFGPEKKAKQADALLVAFPGEAPLPDAELGRMYDFYEPRVIQNGPAMTDAIHAIIAARLGRGDESLQRFRGSYQPFVRPPYLLFSEKRTRDNVCFLTGASGVVEAVLYGFAGLRLEGSPDSSGRPRLDPHLPPGWSGMTLHGLMWHGKSWDVQLRPGAPPAWSPFRQRSAVDAGGGVRPADRS